MGVYRTQSGRWAYSIQRGGHRIRVTVGTKQEAEEAYRRALDDSREGDCRVTLHAWLPVVIRRCARSVTANTLLSYGNSARLISSGLPDAPLNLISPDDVSGYIQARSARVASSTINRELYFLSKAYRLAIQDGLVSKNPVKGLELDEETGRCRFLSVEEIGRLLKACGDDVRPIVEVAIYSGLRLREILGLRWTDVGSGYLVVRGRKWKGGAAQPVRVPQRVQEVLRSLHRSCEWVFPSTALGRRKSCRTAFLGACRRAGLQDVTFHDLRHTFASHAVMNGMSLPVLKEILGHSRLDMVMKYAHLAQDHVDEVLESVIDKLTGSVNNCQNAQSCEPGPDDTTHDGSTSVPR